MSTTKTVYLELLRDGPSHNQLLSPLTVYLAACQNRPPETVRLTVEHQDFLRWQGGLTYAETSTEVGPDRGLSRRAQRSRFDATRTDAIADATKAVTGVLGSIRALIAELASEPCDWRHIHLVLDAAELGSLPFELARAAPGLMVEGERLFVQQNARVTLTRQTRRVATLVVTWPRRPRILCIVGDGDLPLDAHVLALRQSIDPWIGWNDGDNDPGDAESTDDVVRLLANRRREAQQMLTVMVNPTLDEISRETRRTTYTHVHVLAHGAPLEDVGRGQTLYGLCFRGPRGGGDVVDGDRLEAALRHTRDCINPTVVTLATCEGGNVTGGVLGPGGSVAHALHAKGVPLVVSAQFPLSKGASSIFAEMMYAGLLRGEDPREVVHWIRRELIVTYPDSHDWASLVVYGSFPADLDHQLRIVKQTAEKLAVETAAERLRVTLRRWRSVNRQSEQPEESEQSKQDQALRQRLETDVDRLDRAMLTVRGWTEETNDLRVRVSGYRLLARIALRVWDLLVVSSRERRPTGIESSIAAILGRQSKHDDATGQRPISMLTSRELLEFAQDCYTMAYALDGSQVEVWVQVAFLYWLRSAEPGGASADSPRGRARSAIEKAFHQELDAIRHMASKQVALGERAGGSTRDAVSLRTATIFEVALLTRLARWGVSTRDAVTVEEAFDAFVDAAAPISTSYRAHALWRQLRRYETVVAAKALAESYRRQLEALDVRKYWGPRS